MRLKAVCTFMLLIIIVGVGTLVNVHYVERMYTIKDPKPGTSIRSSFSSSTVSPSCPEEYSIDADKLEEFTKVKQKSLYDSSKHREYNQTVVILTPISNVGGNLVNYFRLLCSLSYPHHLISVVLGEDTSTDKSLEVAKMYAKKLGSNFRRIDVHRLPEDLKEKPLHTRHDYDWQRKRRAHLAQSRNRVLSLGLQDEDWVLWLDADITYAPPDIIQHLMSCEADVCAASCLSRTASGWKNYDMNSWQETNASLTFLKSLKPEYLMVEGYGATKRRILPTILDQGLTVDLDGVGGCTLLIKADCHRKGLVFPTFVFDHHIETEGMAKLAKKMDMSVKGLPYISVLHA